MTTIGALNRKLIPSGLLGCILKGRSEFSKSVKTLMLITNRESFLPMDKQSQIISKMTPQAKLKAAMNLYWSARQLKASWLSQLHPDWSQQQIDKAVKDIFLHARS